MNRVWRLHGPQGQRIVLVAGITGLASDETIMRSAFPAEGAASVLLGIPFEDLDAIRATAGKEHEAEFESDELDGVYMDRLKRFGKVQTPPADLYAAHDLATASQVPVDAIDLGDEAYTEAYTKHVGMFEVLRSNRRQRKIPDEEFEAATPEEFVLAWDAEVFAGKGARRVQAAREEFMATRLSAVMPAAVPHVALVPLARAEGIVRRLLASGWREG